MAFATAFAIAARRYRGTVPVDDFHFDAVRGIGKAHNLVAAPVEALDACAVEGHRLMQGPTRRLQYAALNLALDFTLSQEERSAYPGGCRKQHEGSTEPASPHRTSPPSDLS